MRGKRVFRSEFRKLTSTKMPWAFLCILGAMAGINAFAVISGTDMDGSKTFISTEADQQSLMAFAANAVMISSLFGAIAVAREYGHRTVVPTFLALPRRLPAVLAQFAAVAVAGGGVGLVGAGLTIAAVAVALPATEFGFMVSTAHVLQVLLASAFSGAAGATLGAGIGAVVRNVGGAVTATVVALIVAPPLIVQLANGTAPWMPSVLSGVLAGVGTDTGTWSAIAGLAGWALAPAVAGMIAVLRRDVV